MSDSVSNTDSDDPIISCCKLEIQTGLRLINVSLNDEGVKTVNKFNAIVTYENHSLEGILARRVVLLLELEDDEDESSFPISLSLFENVINTSSENEYDKTMHSESSKSLSSIDSLSADDTTSFKIDNCNQKEKTYMFSLMSKLECISEVIPASLISGNAVQYV